MQKIIVVTVLSSIFFGYALANTTGQGRHPQGTHPTK